jgi:uncharacterized protein (DUF58 family)
LSLPPEILKKVKLLEISTRKMVNNIFAGEYHSAYKGQGMTFSEFREYVPGDDVRTISWALTARTGKTFIKKYDEEREMTLILAVDVSGSTDFGSQNYFKGEVIAHLAALLGFSASKNNDPVGLLLFSDQVEHYVPPKKGHGQIHRILRDLYFFKPKSRRTQVSASLEFLQGVLKKRSNIFLFSDFMDEGYEKSLRLIGQKHDMVSVIVNDPNEYEIPDLGIVDLQDSETGEILTLDTSSKGFRDYYKQYIQSQNDSRDKNLRRTQVDKITIDINKDITEPLIAFFKKRNRGR